MRRLLFHSEDREAGRKAPQRGAGLLLLVVLFSLLGAPAAHALPIVVESYRSDCATQADDFPRPSTVCAKVSGIPGPYPKSGRIRWWAPGLNPASDASTFSLPFSTSTGNATDVRSLTDCGTWTVRVYVPTGTFQDEDTFALTGCNLPPSPGTISGDSSVLEGSAHAYQSTASDPEGDALTYVWSIASGGSFAAITGGQGTPTVNVSFTDDGTVVLHVAVSDPTHPAVSPPDASVAVGNVAPTLGITAPPGGTSYAVGDPVQLDGWFGDAGTGDTHTCTVAWDDGGTTAGSVSESGGSGTCGATRTYASAGTYTIAMTVTDDDGAATTQSVMVVVVDPEAGFVNGGGWFASPAGAYAPRSSLAGRFRFSFVSRYARDATSPSGQIEMHYDPARLDFQSKGEQHWLVVSGAMAQYNGFGALGGEPGYRFLLTAYDGDHPGGDGVDRIRVKIWDPDGSLVYDNAASSGSDDMDAADPQPIGAGNITVHSA